MPFIRDDRALIDERTDLVVARSVVRAAGALSRSLGLMAFRPAPDDALWLEPCNGIHTFLLRRAIDVIVLDRSLRVVALRRAVPPWRIVLPVRGGHTTVELTAGAIDAAGVQVGDTLRLLRAPGPGGASG